MKVAIIGSRNIKNIVLEQYISDEVNEIVSGGAVGVDSCAAEYAKKNGLKLTVFLPQYERYGRAAPIVRNKKIVEYADKVLAFWDGKSKGTKNMIEEMRRAGKHGKVIFYEKS